MRESHSTKTKWCVYDEEQRNTEIKFCISTRILLVLKQLCNKMQL